MAKYNGHLISTRNDADSQPKLTRYVSSVALFPGRSRARPAASRALDACDFSAGSKAPCLDAVDAFD